MKHLLIVIGFVLAIGGLLFADQVAEIFSGMTPLEAMGLIWTFVLRAVVMALIGYAAVGLPSIVKPWMRMFKKQRRRREQIPATTRAPRMPRFSKDAALIWMMQKLAQRERGGQEPRQDETIRFDL